MRILVAEDDTDWQDILVRHFKAHFPGAECFTAGTTEELFEIARKKGPLNLVSKDCNLGGSLRLAPRELITRLRTEGVNCPIVVVSADQEVVRRGIEAGANGGCWKCENPFDDALAAELRRLGLIQ